MDTWQARCPGESKATVPRLETCNAMSAWSPASDAPAFQTIDPWSPRMRCSPDSTSIGSHSSFVLLVKRGRVAAATGAKHDLAPDSQAGLRLDHSA